MKLKRKALALILSVAVLLALSACGSSSGGSSSQTPVAPSEAAESTPEPASEPTENDQAGGKAVGSGDLGDYHAEIKGAALAKDYEGNPAIVITYEWTNNSDDTTSAMVAVTGKAFQDGVQLETAIIMGDDSYDSGTSMKEVRPGTTVDIQCAYVLTSETSTVEFELTEWISFSDDMVTMDFDPASLT